MGVPVRLACVVFPLVPGAHRSATFRARGQHERRRPDHRAERARIVHNFIRSLRAWRPG
jgi:hypothetical protein